MSAIDRCVEDCGYDIELLDSVVLVASVYCHLPHEQGFGVAAVLLPSHPVRLVRALPDKDVSIGPALFRQTPRPRVLGTGDEVNPAIPQFAYQEVVVEQGVGKNHVTRPERAVHLPQQGGFTGALALVRRDGQIVTGAGC